MEKGERTRLRHNARNGEPNPSFGFHSSESPSAAVSCRKRYQGYVRRTCNSLCGCAGASMPTGRASCHGGSKNAPRSSSGIWLEKKPGASRTHGNMPSIAAHSRFSMMARLFVRTFPSFASNHCRPGLSRLEKARVRRHFFFGRVWIPWPW